MKLNKYFMGFLGALAMTACSSEEPAVTGGVDDDATFSDNYMSISIQMPNDRGRADEDVDYNDYGNYTDGTEAESNVGNVVFFFFDANNNCVDIQKYNKYEFDRTPSSQNPYVTSIGVKEIRLKSGLDYSQVAVVLNSSVDNASDYRATIKTLADLEARSQDYVAGLNADGSNQVMSNSVYYENDAEGNPIKEKKIILVPITENNIYTSADREKAGVGNLPENKEYVDIYVERVLARVDVECKIDVEKNYYVDADTKANTITIYDNVNLTTKQVTIRPVLLGMTLNVLTNEAKLIKPISATQVGYGIGSGSYKAFQWNDPANKRSYWANTTTYDKSEMTYYSWNDTKGKGVGANDNLGSFSKYIHPNTQAFEPTETNENSSLNTKVMVVAQLKAVEKGDDGKDRLLDIDLVRYGSEYMEASGLLAHVANTVNIAARSINWNDPKYGLTSAEAEILSVAVHNSFLSIEKEKNGIKANMFELGMLSSSDSENNVDYEAKISKSNKFNYDIVVDETLYDDVADLDAHAILDDADAVAALIAKAKPTVDSVIAEAIDAVNVPRILYWNNGMTYYYVNIRQQGFYGLVGDGADNWLNGVVRNHIYQIKLTGIYGLGTPVINPEEPIDPERPTLERPSYIQARINVLPWRIVENNATIH